MWPEPLTRTSTDVRTVVAPPPGVELSLPEGCQHLGEVSQSTTKEVQRFRLVNTDQKHSHTFGPHYNISNCFSACRDKHFQDVTDQNILQPLGNIISVLDQMMNKEVRMR